MDNRVWAEINYEACSAYFKQIRQSAKIITQIPHWHKLPEATLRDSYLVYIGRVLRTIAEELDRKVEMALSVLVIPAQFLPVLYFGSFDRALPAAISGPYFAGILSESVNIIVDPDCSDNEMYAYNINEPDRVLKFEVED